MEVVIHSADPTHTHTHTPFVFSTLFPFPHTHTHAAAILDFSEGDVIAAACGESDAAAVPDPLMPMSSSGADDGCGGGGIVATTTSGPRTRSMSVSFRDDAGMEMRRASSSSSAMAMAVPSHAQMTATTTMTMGRDRGYSFECFSLGIDGDEPLFPGDGDDDGGGAPRHQRPRGDSIIFDPTSFLMGGIHETSALSSRYEDSGGGVDADDGGARMMGGYAPDGVGSSVSVPLAPTTASYFPPDPSEYPPPPPPPPPSPAGLDAGGAARAKTADSARSSSFLGDGAIHMPHGSDAAAAAVAGIFHRMSSSRAPNGGGGDDCVLGGDGAPSSSSSSSSSSHTACPMELLNRGGRIGIYLPEERKARIAKFHSKRKIRIWRKRIKYDCRKKLADSRPRIKGRFVKRSDVDGEGFL